jgi:Druantia protein DruA
MNITTESKKYSGKYFSPNDIECIKQLLITNPKANRAALSRLVCEQFKWFKMDGNLKEMSCRVAMINMERDKLIILPKPLHKKYPCHAHKKQTSKGNPGQPVNCAVSELSNLQIQPVERDNSGLWNELIERYHYLGYQPLSGAQIRYFVYSNEQLIALLSFGASAWTTAPRDQFIGWRKSQRESRLHQVINNARFLILPWIKVPHLASKILSMAARRVQADWLERYHYQPVLLETFVEVERFKGTCYKAANWQCLGTTTGRGKKGGHQASLPVKSVWIYPLNKHFKKILCA